MIRLCRRRLPLNKMKEYLGVTCYVMALYEYIFIHPVTVVHEARFWVLFQRIFILGQHGYSRIPCPRGPFEPYILHLTESRGEPGNNSTINVITFVIY